MKLVCLRRPPGAAHALWYGAASEFLDSGAQSSSMGVRETLLRPRANGALRPVGTGSLNVAQYPLGGISKARSEEPIEMREIGKADFKRNIGDAAIAVGRDEKVESAVQAVFIDVLGERLPGRLQQPLLVPLRDPQPASKISPGEIGLVKVGGEIFEHGRSPRGDDATDLAFADRRSSRRQHGQIDHVAGNGVTRFRFGRQPTFGENPDIAKEKPETFRTAIDDLHQSEVRSGVADAPLRTRDAD